jgi:hypothetical protein
MNRERPWVVVGPCPGLRVPTSDWWANCTSSTRYRCQRYVSGLVGGDRRRAEDIAQETLLRASRHPEVLHDEAARRRPGLFSFARNLVMEAHRAQSARPREVLDDLPGGPGSTDGGMDFMLIRFGASRSARARLQRGPLHRGGGRVARSARGNRQFPLPLRDAYTSLPVPGEGPGSVNCREVQEEIAVGLLTAADLDEPTCRHSASGLACAAQRLSLRQGRSFRGLAR